MASPRTRRVLQDLRPSNENTVSESAIKMCLIFGYNDAKINFVVLIRNALSVQLIVHNGYL